MSQDERDQQEPDKDRVQDSAIDRQINRAKNSEEASGSLGEMLGEHKYPTTSEELATEYADQEIDMANETESLGDVFDRLVDEHYESAEEAREAAYGEITGEQAGSEEYNESRDLSDLEDEDDQADQ